MTYDEISVGDMGAPPIRQYPAAYTRLAADTRISPRKRSVRRKYTDIPGEGIWVVDCLFRYTQGC